MPIFIISLLFNIKRFSIVSENICSSNFKYHFEGLLEESPKIIRQLLTKLQNTRNLLFISIFLANNALASQDQVFQDKYTPIIDLFVTKNKQRTIGEIDLLTPILQRQNNLNILDIKLKKDDRKGFEYNFGLVHRFNIEDKWIFGIYNYFDRRKTGNNLYANQWTVGTEILSNYLDGRLNFYIPQNKKKIITTKPAEFRCIHTTVYAERNGNYAESTLPGYDIELGTPLFGLLPRINEKFGTKVYVAKYDFRRKGVPRNTGIRVRLEQEILAGKLGNNKLTLHLGTHYTNKKKWDNFIGLNIRVPLSVSNVKRSKLQERMMDNVVRDVDIKTEKYISNSKEPLYLYGKKIDKIYFVTEKADNSGNDSLLKILPDGDGSYERPFTVKQLSELIEKGEFQKQETDLIVPIGSFTSQGYDNLVNQYPIEDTAQNIMVLRTISGTSFNMDDYFHLTKQDALSISDNTSTNETVKNENIPYEDMNNTINKKANDIGTEPSALDAEPKRAQVQKGFQQGQQHKQLQYKAAEMHPAPKQIQVVVASAPSVAASVPAMAAVFAAPERSTAAASPFPAASTPVLALTGGEAGKSKRIPLMQQAKQLYKKKHQEPGEQIVQVKEQLKPKIIGKMNLMDKAKNIVKEQLAVGNVVTQKRQLEIKDRFNAHQLNRFPVR